MLEVQVGLGLTRVVLSLSNGDISVTIQGGT